MGAWAGRELVPDFRGERLRLVERHGLRMRAENLLEQGGAAAGMAAEQGQALRHGPGRRLVAPAPDHCRCQGGEQLAAGAAGFVADLFQGGDVGGAANLGFGFGEPAEGLFMLAEFVEGDGEQMAAGDFEIGVGQIFFDQRAEDRFGVGRPAFAVEEEGPVIERARVVRVARQRFLRALPGGVQVMLALQPGGQTEVGMNGGWRGLRSLLETGPREIWLAEAMILLAEGEQEIGVGWRQLAGVLKGAFRQIKIKRPKRGQAALELQIGNGGKSFDQSEISGEGDGGAAMSDMLPGILPAGEIAIGKRRGSRFHW